MRKAPAVALLALPVLALVCAPAAASEARPRTSGDDRLPGVNTGSIAPTVSEPLPEPTEALPAGEQPGSIRVGDWDITISGSVSWEIGTGRPRDGR